MLSDLGITSSVWWLWCWKFIWKAVFFIINKENKW